MAAYLEIRSKRSRNPTGTIRIGFPPSIDPSGLSSTFWSRCGD
jgi:hypothetical protein